MHFIDDFTLLTNEKIKTGLFVCCHECVCETVWVCNFFWYKLFVHFIPSLWSLSLSYLHFPIEMTHVWLSRITCCDIKTPVKTITPLMHMSISTNEIEDVVSMRWPSSAGSIGTGYCSSGVCVCVCCVHKNIQKKSKIKK